MSIIKLGPIETVTSLTLTTSLGDSLEREDYQSTSISALSTSLASSVIDKPHVELNIAQKYIDSLSDSQLAEMVERLSEKNEDLTYLTVNVTDAEQSGYEETPKTEQPAQPTMPTMPPVGLEKNGSYAMPTQPVQPTEPPARSR